jgi:hypothetical protein
MEYIHPSCRMGRIYSVIVHTFGRLTDVRPIKAYLFAFFILPVAKNNVVYDIFAGKCIVPCGDASESH